MGKLTISMAIFNSYFDITRGYVWMNYHDLTSWHHWIGLNHPHSWTVQLMHLTLRWGDLGTSSLDPPKNVVKPRVNHPPVIAINRINHSQMKVYYCFTHIIYIYMYIYIHRVYIYIKIAVYNVGNPMPAINHSDARNWARWMMPWATRRTASETTGRRWTRTDKRVILGAQGAQQFFKH